MGLRTRRNKPEPTAKFIGHQKTVALHMELPLELLREPQAAEIVAQLAKRRIEAFIAKGGLHGTDRGNETDASTD